MSKQYDKIVFIGRFQPFHNQHFETVIRALDLADDVIIAIGSVNRSRNIKDPWTFEERRDMIISNFDKDQSARIKFVPIKDHLYNDTLWATRVAQSISEHIKFADRVGLIGANKDESSFYLDLFPGFERVPTDHVVGIDATNIRNKLFSNQFDAHLAPMPPQTHFWIDVWKEANRGEFERLCEEFHFIRRYHRAWEVAPYPPTFVTVDAVVTCGDHILLVERKAAPGEGLWALPGGFVDQKERLVSACIRELREETRLKVPEAVLRNRIVRQQVFDHPSRSLRGRTLTHAFHIPLEDKVLPKVKGGDDAARAFWVPLSDVVDNQRNMYEDHAFIIEEFTGINL